MQTIISTCNNNNNNSSIEQHACVAFHVVRWLVEITNTLKANTTQQLRDEKKTWLRQKKKLSYRNVILARFSDVVALFIYVHKSHKKTYAHLNQTNLGTKHHCRVVNSVSVFRLQARKHINVWNQTQNKTQQSFFFKKIFSRRVREWTTQSPCDIFSPSTGENAKK